MPKILLKALTIWFNQKIIEYNNVLDFIIIFIDLTFIISIYYIWIYLIEGFFLVKIDRSTWKRYTLTHTYTRDAHRNIHNIIHRGIIKLMSLKYLWMLRDRISDWDSIFRNHVFIHFHHKKIVTIYINVERKCLDI